VKTRLLLTSTTTALFGGVATLPKASECQIDVFSININKPSGARRDSATYVRMKKKACTEIGIASFGTDFEADVTQEQLIAKIDELNAGTASILHNTLFYFTPALILIILFIRFRFKFFC
jgi:5,10-methylene-tetrahydrofolate dehydrogenase/methenyl tetrahydrofolate cyclohydrolase